MRIAVVGAGIVGVSCALYLQRDGHDVTLIDHALLARQRHRECRWHRHWGCGAKQHPWGLA